MYHAALIPYLCLLNTISMQSCSCISPIRLRATWGRCSANHALLCYCVRVLSERFHFRTTWLRCSGYHQLDFLVFNFVFLEYVSAVFGYRGISLRPLRFIRIIRTITRIKTFSSILTIMHTLRMGFGQLITVFAMLLFFVGTFRYTALDPSHVSAPQTA